MSRVLHEPQLDTILMVEETLRRGRSFLTKKALWSALPRQVQYQTFNRILEYLESSNKILVSEAGIVWIFPDNPKLRRLVRTSVRLR